MSLRFLCKLALKFTRHEKILKMNVQYYFVILVLLLAPLAGCGSNCAVSGKVAFPDGTPLTSGHVLFESPTLMSRGYIQKDGSYTMLSGDDKGVPKGTYQVSIGGLDGFHVEEIPSDNPRIPPRTILTPRVSPIHKKFSAASTSGLTCEVKGRTKYDITVEPPE